METLNTKIKENQFLIEPYRFIAALRKNLWLIILGIILFTMAGITIAKMKESKSWTATAKLIRYDKKISNSSDIPYQFQNFNYETALETIRTRSNLIALIETLDLNTTPESLFSKFEIKRGRNSDIIEVIFTSDQKKLAAMGANTLSKIFIKNFYITQNAAIQRIYDYYEKNKQKKVNELSLSKKAISDFLKEYDLISLENELEIKYLQLNKLQLNKLQNTTKTQALKAAIDELTISLSKLPDEIKLKYTVRATNKKNLELKEQELRKLKNTYTNLHPKVKMTVREIIQLKNTIKNAQYASPDEVTYGGNPLKSTMRIELSKTKITYISAKKTDSNLKEQINIIEDRIVYLSDLKKHFDTLVMTKEEAMRQLIMVSNRLSDLKLAIGSSKEDFKLFEEAKIPEFPQPTYKKLIVIMFGIMGLILSLIFIIVKEFFDNTIKTTFDLSERFGINEVIQLPKKNKTIDEIKKRFSYLINTIISKSYNHTHTLVIGSDVEKSFDPKTNDMILGQLAHQNKKVLYIEMINVLDEETADASFNVNTLMKEENFKPVTITNMLHKGYWHLEENYSIMIPSKSSLETVIQYLKDLNYDYLIIKAPAYTQAEHLVPILIEQSDTFLLETKFQVSSREVLLHLMKRLDDNNINKIKGVIHECNKYFIS